jgi:hypothetical protein
MESKKDEVQIDETKLRRLQFRVYNLEKQNVGPNGLKANERVKKIISLIEAEVENDN